MQLRAADTIKNAIDPNAPAKAGFLSALVPGLRQAYNKKYWKIPIGYGCMSAGIYVYTFDGDASVNRADFGIGSKNPALGDFVNITFSCELNPKK